MHSECVRLELADRGSHGVSICPGLTIQMILRGLRGRICQIREVYEIVPCAVPFARSSSTATELPLSLRRQDETIPTHQVIAHRPIDGFDRVTQRDALPANLFTGPDHGGMA